MPSGFQMVISICLQTGMSQAQKVGSSSKLESDRGQTENNGTEKLEESVTSTVAETEQAERQRALVRASSNRALNHPPQTSGPAAGSSPSHMIVSEEITVGVPLFRPKKEFLKILKSGGADCDFLTKKEMCHYLKEYVFRKRLYNPHDPREVNCGEDELGRVFNVQKFTISEVLHLIHKNCNQLPDSQLKKTQILVARPVGRSHQGTGAATSTQITHVSGEGFSPVVCIGLCHPTSVIASTVSSSSSSGASSVQSTSNSPLRTSREAGDSRQPRRRSKRRPRPKRRKAERTGTDQNQPSTSGASGSVPPHSSQQEGSSSKPEDSSDDLWFLEEEGPQESDTFSIEYELEDSEPTDILSESSSVISGQGVIVVCSDSDVEFWADESDTEWNEADHWACECGTKNKPPQRHCIYCWKIRPGWLAEKRKRSLSSEDTDSSKKVKDDFDSGVCLSSQDTTPSQTMELHELGTRRSLLNYRSQSPVQKGPEDPCVICLKRPKTGSIIHGSTGHQVCCYPCAKRLKRRKGKCPVCRRKIKDVIRNYVL